MNVKTDTEVAVPEEFEIDQKLLEACKGSSSSLLLKGGGLFLILVRVFFHYIVGESGMTICRDWKSIVLR